MALTALRTQAGWQRRGCFAPPPPSDSLMPEELSCGKRPKLCTDTVALAHLLQPPAALAGSQGGCSPPHRAAPGCWGHGAGLLYREGAISPPSARTVSLPALGIMSSDRGSSVSLCPAAPASQTLLCRSPDPVRNTSPAVLPGAVQQARALHALIPQLTAPQHTLKKAGAHQLHFLCSLSEL